MSRFGSQGPGANASYFGQQDLVAGGAVILSVVPPAPVEGQTGVTVTVQDDGGSQGAFTYAGLSAAVTGYVGGNPAVYTLTWPSIAFEASTTTFNANYPLQFSVSGAPLSVQTSPIPTRDYLVNVLNDTGVAGTWDNDIASGGVEVGADLFYAEYVPDDPLVDRSLAQKGIFNNWLDGWQINYRWWDVSIGQWSNLATETFSVIGITALQPLNLTHSQTIQEPVSTVETGIVPQSLTQAHTLSDSSVLDLGRLDVANLTQAQTVAVVDLIQTGQFEPVDLTQAQSLDAPTITQEHKLSPLPLSQAQTLTDPPSTSESTVLPAGLIHKQLLDQVDVIVEGLLTPADIAHIQTLGAAVLTQTQIFAALDLSQVQTIGGPTASLPSAFIGEGRALIIAPRDRALQIAARIRAIMVER